MSLTISSKRNGNIEILVLAGRLTLGDGSSSLRAVVKETLERTSSIVVDLSSLAYIDSAGLGELVSGYASAKARGAEMKLLRPSKRVDSMLQITKLYTTFEVFEDEAAAVASFRG